MAQIDWTNPAHKPYVEWIARGNDPRDFRGEKAIRRYEDAVDYAATLQRKLILLKKRDMAYQDLLLDSTPLLERVELG